MQCVEPVGGEWNFDQKNRLPAPKKTISLGLFEPWYPIEDEIDAACVSHTIEKVSDRGWLHHIERLMILGNVALQRGLNPQQLNEWFVNSFVDGTPWVMPANVIGMSQFADGGMMSTKPYAGGAYISKMTHYCGGCVFDPKVRVGGDAKDARSPRHPRPGTPSRNSTLGLQGWQSFISAVRGNDRLINQLKF